MSHIVECKILIKDLSALKQAVGAIPGLEWLEAQTNYRWYGTSVGDYPLPAGVKKEDLGKCIHAIGVKGSQTAYEIGVVARQDGLPGYTLLMDFWGSNGKAIANLVGQAIPTGETKELRNGLNTLRLENHYGARVAAKIQQRKGYRVTITEDPITRKVQALCRK